MISRARPLLFAALVVATGCGSAFSFASPRRTTTFTPRAAGSGNGATTQPGQTTATPPADTQAFLNQIDARLRGNGFTPAGAAIRNNAMPSTGLIAYALDVQPGRCYAAIGVGDAGTDLNMILLDPSGRTESHHVQPDSTPWVKFCPNQAGRYIVRLQMQGQQGGYYYLSYQGPQNRDPQLAAFFAQTSGAQNTSSAQRTASLDRATRTRIEQAGSSLGRGYSSVGEPVGVVLDQREARVFPLNLSTNNCYAFGAFGGSGVLDSDISITDGSGAQLVSDPSDGRDALVRFCPPSAGTYQLHTLSFVGEGPVFVTGWQQPRPNQGNSGTGNTGTGNTGTDNSGSGSVLTGNSQAASGLAEAYALVDIDMQARGYATIGAAQDGQLASGASSEFSIRVEDEKCYAIVAIGDNGVRNIDLTLVDGSGRTLDSETEISGRSIVRTCANSSGNRTIRLAMASGSGNFKFATYQFQRGTRGPFGLSGLTWVRLSEVTALLQVENYEPSLAFDIETGRLTAGRAVSANLTLESNKCYAIVVAGGDGISSLSIELKRGSNSVAENTTGSSFPDVRVCTTSVTGGRHTLHITPTAGSGNYAYQVFERPTQ